MPCVAVLLAAGAGTRFAGPEHKLLALIGGQPVWRLSLERAQGAGFDHVIVVTGALPLPLPPGVIEQRNPAWAQGQATSLAAGVAAARALGANTVTVGLADQPFITSAAWKAVADAPPDCRIVIASYDGEVGPNPVRLHESVWPLLPTTGDQGARTLISDHPEWVCRVACLGSVADIDTLEDLGRWKSC